MRAAPAFMALTSTPPVGPATSRMTRGPCRPGPRTRAARARRRDTARRSLGAGKEARQRRDRVGRLEGGQDALRLRRERHRREGLVVRRGRELHPTGGMERGQLRADARVVEPRRHRVRLDDLAVAVLQHHRPGAVEDPRRAAGEGRRVPSGRDPVPRRLGDGDPDGRLADEPCEQPDRVGAAADAREGEIRQPPLRRDELDSRLVADQALEVADDRRVRMRAHRRSQHVVGRPTFVTQSRIASLIASLSVALPRCTARTSAPRACIRSTFGCWRSMSSAPMYTTHGSSSSAQAVAVATPCWPAPVSAMTRVLPSRRVSSAWPSALLILWAPVWARSSRFRYRRRVLGTVCRSRSAGLSRTRAARRSAR